MKWLYLLGGHISLGLGMAGVFLPVLPTTPFILVAAFCYSRSSPKFHDYLMNHPRFGQIVRDWRDGQVIRPHIKCIAVVMLNGFIAYPVFFLALPLWLKVLLVLTALGVSTFILTRPSRKPVPQQDTETASNSPS